jgi:hypothetical protein
MGIERRKRRETGGREIVIGGEGLERGILAVCCFLFSRHLPSLKK